MATSLTGPNGRTTAMTLLLVVRHRQLHGHTDTSTEQGVRYRKCPLVGSLPRRDRADTFRHPAGSAVQVCSAAARRSAAANASRPPRHRPHRLLLGPSGGNSLERPGCRSWMVTRNAVSCFVSPVQGSAPPAESQDTPLTLPTRHHGPPDLPRKDGRLRGRRSRELSQALAGHPLPGQQIPASVSRVLQPRRDALPHTGRSDPAAGVPPMGSGRLPRHGAARPHPRYGSARSSK